MPGPIRAIEFHPPLIDDFINRHGQRVLYKQSYRCACFDEDSQNKDINCKLCDIDGYRYECGVPLKAIITGIQDAKGFTQVGLLKQGDCAAGFHWNVPVRFHDEVILMLQQTTVEALMVNDPLFPPMLKDYMVCNLRKARTLDREFIPYKDWMLDTDGRTIVWMNENNRPADMEKFTVQVDIRPTYIVWDTEGLTRHTDSKNLPRYVHLRMKDDFGGLGQDYNGGT